MKAEALGEEAEDRARKAEEVREQKRNGFVRSAALERQVEDAALDALEEERRHLAAEVHFAGQNRVRDAFAQKGVQRQHREAHEARVRGGLRHVEKRPRKVRPVEQGPRGVQEAQLVENREQELVHLGVRSTALRLQRWLGARVSGALSGCTARGSVGGLLSFRGRVILEAQVGQRVLQEACA